MKMFVITILALVSTVVASATITPTASQMWWGYFSESDVSGLPYGGNLGYGSACTIDAAIYIPANEQMVGSSTIKAVRFWLGNQISAINSDLTVWISTTQPSSISNCDYRQNVAQSSLASGVNEVELSTPFTVNNQAVYVGFTFSIGSGAWPVMSNGIDVAHAFYYRVNSGSWNDFYDTGYGKLALQILLDGGNYVSNAATPADFGQKNILIGENMYIPITITNCGKDPITSISYTISTQGGATTSEMTQNVNLPYLNSTTNLAINFAEDSEPGKKQKTLTITKVNGVANNATQKSATGCIVLLSEKLPVKPVVEEFTGTWCGYCVYGFVGMQSLRDTYGDQVTLIAAHSGDVMDIGSYKPIINTFSDGFPSAVVDRQTSVYPYGSSLTYSVSSALNRMTLGKVELTAQWSNAGKTAVTFNTNTTFAYNDENGQYGLAFVLLENGLKGTSSSWNQSNYLSGGGGSDDMQFWYNAGSSVSGIEYNYVAVEAWSIQNGVNGSVATKIMAGHPQSYIYNGDISSNTLIQDKSKLKAVVLLIDRTSGAIVNSAQAPIEDYASSVSVTMSKEMITYASSRALDFTTPIAGLKAYVVSAVTDGKAVLTEVTGAVPAATGLILKGTAGQSYVIPCATGSLSTVTNKLLGVTTDTTIGGNDLDYILQDGKFVKATSGTLSAGKAYLRLDAALARDVIDIVDDATGICDVNRSKRNAPVSVYNLNGQRISNPTSGLYIINGNKVYVK